jgi:hypothetical protein
MADENPRWVIAAWVGDPQPALFVDNAGDVRMLARTTSRHVAMAVSKNNGKDWCAPVALGAFQP